MDEVQGLRHGLEDRISKHVDVREALLKKKDEQLQGKIYRKNSKTIRGFLFFFSQKLRITFECGLHSSADFIFLFFQKR